MYKCIITENLTYKTKSQWKFLDFESLYKSSNIFLSQINVVKRAEWFKAVFWLDKVEFGLTRWLWSWLHTRLHVPLPVGVGLGVADVLQGLDVDLTPTIKVQWPHFRDVTA